MSTAVSRAWLGVAFTGLLVVVLMLIPRLGAGQRVIDTAKPAFTDERVAGTRAGIDLLSRYVDAVDPLLATRGRGSRDVRTLVGLMRRKLGLSTAQVRKILRREAPHVEALTSALPLGDIAGELPRLTAYLSTILVMSEEQVGATLEQSFPRFAQTLTALRSVSDAWYDVPAIDGLTRLRGDKPVRTVPGLRKYYRDDVTPLMVEHREHFQAVAGTGGVGYIPTLLLVLGIGMLAFGLLQARGALRAPPGRFAWGVVMGAGVAVLLIVAVLQYFPRLGGAQKLVTDFEPVFTAQRVSGAANGFDTVHDAIAFGDPVMTRDGGAARESQQLYRFIAQRTGVTPRAARRALRRRVPRTVALFDALPLTEVSREIPPLLRYLSRALRLRGDRLTATLDERTPALAQVLGAVPHVTAGWNAVPGTTRMTRFDGMTPVRTMPAVDDYLRQDLIPVLVSERRNFQKLAGTWPPLDVLPPLLFGIGLLMLLYGGAMMRYVAGRY